MADASKFLHTWSLSKDSWLLKFYLFWYPIAERDQITFCKLFWAVVCAPFMGIAWIGIGIGLAIIAPFIWIHDKYEDRQLGKPEPEPEPPKGPSKAKQAAGKIPAFFARLADAVSAWFQKHEKFGTILGWTCLAVAALVVLGALITALVYLVTWLHSIWSGVAFLTALAALGGFIVLIVLGALLAWALSTTKPGEAVCAAIWAFLCAIGHFFQGIGHFFGTGYYAVKYRTCPRVEVSD